MKKVKVKSEESKAININHVAKLANLPLSEIEKKTYNDQLSKILEYIDQIEKGVDIKSAESTFNVSPNKNITRVDTASKSLTQEEAIGNSPSNKNGFFVTKAVFENE